MFIIDGRFDSILQEKTMARILRDWTASDKMHSLSADAERFFTRLIMKADDFGRYYGNPKLLSASLFPLHSEITTNHVIQWINECAAAGVLKKYSVEDKAYLEISGFDQKGLKVRKAKYPPSSEEERQELITGYVYVIGETLQKPVKIGFSMNPWSRLKEINANYPAELSVLLSFRAEKRIESLIHLQLKHRRVKNEWFTLTEFEVDLLKSVADGNLKPENLISVLRSNYEELRNATLPELEVEVEGNSNKNPALCAAVCEIFGKQYQQPQDRMPAMANWYSVIEAESARILQVYSEQDAIKQVRAYMKYCRDQKRKVIGTNYKVSETILSSDWIKLLTPMNGSSVGINVGQNRKVNAS